MIAQANAALDENGKLRRRARLLPQPQRVHAVDAGHDRVHGRRAVADRVGGGLADPVPRARRREPRVDGLEHAAPGGAVPACRRSRWSAPASSARSRSTRARRCRRAAAAWSTTSTRRASWCACNDDETAAGEVGVDIYNLVKYTALEPEHQHQPASAGEGGRPHRARRRDRRRRLDRHGRARARAEHAGRVHAVERLQLRGLDPDLGARGRRRPLHLDPHRGAVGRRARHQARARRDHARHLEPLRERSSRASTSPASSTSAPKSKPATCWSARSRRRARPSSRRKRSCCARSSARRPPT